MLKKFLLLCFCCFTLDSMAEDGYSFDAYNPYTLVNIPLTYVNVSGNDSPPVTLGTGSLHKAPPFLPLQIFFDEENSTLLVEAHRSCTFVLTVKDESDVVWLEETIGFAEPQQTIVPLQALPAGTYTVAVQIGEVSYAGNLDI